MPVDGKTPSSPCVGPILPGALDQTKPNCRICKYLHATSSTYRLYELAPDVATGLSRSRAASWFFFHAPINHTVKGSKPARVVFQRLSWHGTTTSWFVSGDDEALII